MRERTMAELASQLEAALHQIRRESRRLGYVPTRFLQMLNQQRHRRHDLTDVQ